MKTRHSKVTFLFWGAVITVSAFSFVKAQTPKPDEIAIRAELQKPLNDWHKSGKFAGATLGVCLADGKCFGLATGFSDLEKKTPMKPTDLMLAGSVGKTYAAAVALQLVKEKSISTTKLKNISVRKNGFRACRMRVRLRFAS